MKSRSYHTARNPPDHTFDHSPLRSTRKQRKQDRQRAFLAERKRLKQDIRGGEDIKTTVWDAEVARSNRVTPTTGLTKFTRQSRVNFVKR